MRHRCLFIYGRKKTSYVCHDFNMTKWVCSYCSVLSCHTAWKWDSPGRYDRYLACESCQLCHHVIRRSSPIPFLCWKSANMLQTLFPISDMFLREHFPEAYVWRLSSAKKIFTPPISCLFPEAAKNRDSFVWIMHSANNLGAVQECVYATVGDVFLSFFKLSPTLFRHSHLQLVPCASLH